MKLLIATIATILLCRYGEAFFGKAMDGFIDWNMQNLPFVAVVWLYPRLEKIWRWIRFWLYA